MIQAIISDVCTESNGTRPIGRMSSNFGTQGGRDVIGHYCVTMFRTLA